MWFLSNSLKKIFVRNCRYLYFYLDDVCSQVIVNNLKSLVECNLKKSLEFYYVCNIILKLKIALATASFN